ncbi:MULTISPECIES: DNA helicase II [unclassified Gilliamella]|uniref:DNA helicase II n=1 Tax=unclassified Gilliamella TaxID=2685620 RepID=UPI00130C241A|nr:DNA helicase II [Gilliamella sp. Lep-s35]MWP68994.1 DNA helicase II [Gilliamella sp. Lep-s5]MWP77361.1 DNA helicase II [Gilliamella sp. Lep-s21]
METSQSLLEDLNIEQKNATTTDNQYTIVLAGAGSGKTRVLVHRIAWLCIEKQYSPGSIFAVTFTNKAAAEMQERIQALVGEGYFNGMWVGTFHGLAHRLLRMFSEQAKLPPNFQLIDTEDQVRLIKRIFRELKIDEKQWSAKQCAAFISTQKEKGHRAGDIVPEDPKQVMWQKIYHDYQVICDKLGYLDFSELILRTYELLCQNQEVLNYCHRRFCNILIDEFQDTNKIQYRLVKKLAGNTANVMIVGDDDQSIYSWRGANADNLQLFINDYPETEIIRLEQNYRSTNNILDAANKLIAQNTKRLGKNLWTDRGDGEQILLYIGYNDIDEARFVTGQIKKRHQEGDNYSSCAILYRSNAQSRIFEDTLLQAGLPYQIYGSIRFYERQEVKLALAYLRLLYDHNNDMAFEAVINTPTRGIGTITLDRVRTVAKQYAISLWDACLMLIQTNALSERQCSGLSRFLDLMEFIFDKVESQPVYKQLDMIIKLSGILQMYEQEPGIKGQSRLENLEELVSAAEQFHHSNENTIIQDNETGKTLTVLESFLAYTSLESRDVINEQDSIQLMTLHSAKGLEFDNVFIVGLEDGVFPDQRSAQDPEKIEEERRLAYVGITRARKHLTLSLAQIRRLYGREERNLPSRFLNELPIDVLKEISHQGFIRPSDRKEYNNSYDDCKKIYPKKARQNDDGYRLGRKVRHSRFGEGTIVNIDGEADHKRVQIAFINEGIKWLVVKLANLTLL